jgi:hypothetical protein
MSEPTYVHPPQYCYGGRVRLLPILGKMEPTYVGGYDPAVTRILRESAVGCAARATALAVSASGKWWVIKGRTSSRREKTRRATSACNVKSDE